LLPCLFSRNKALRCGVGQLPPS